MLRGEKFLCLISTNLQIRRTHTLIRFFFWKFFKRLDIKHKIVSHTKAKWHHNSCVLNKTHTHTHTKRNYYNSNKLFINYLRIQKCEQYIKFLIYIFDSSFFIKYKYDLEVGDKWTVTWEKRHFFKIL